MKNESKIILPLWFIVAFLTFVTLYLWKNIFVILVFTTLLLILFSGIFRYFHRLSWYNFIAAWITGFIFISFFFIIGFIISTQIDGFIDNFDKFWAWVEKFVDSFWFFGQPFSNFNYQKMFQNIDFWSIGLGALTTITSIVWWMTTVGILLIFILIEKNTFLKKLDKISTGKLEKKIHTIYSKIYEDINVFILSKFFVASINGIVSVIIMYFFGLEYALLFWLFVFLLDFIPSVWWIIAMAMPFLYSFVQFDQTGLSFLLLAFLIVPQFITGNIIEPKLLGTRLNLSGFVIIISLIFWSSLWGITGAFLAVPITAMLNIVFARFESTKAIAVILSKNGDI